MLYPIAFAKILQQTVLVQQSCNMYLSICINNYCKVGDGKNNMPCALSLTLVMYVANSSAVTVLHIPAVCQQSFSNNCF